MKNLKEKKASQIFEIIRKLNKDEKRAFKLYATTYERKGNTVIALFDLIYEYTHNLPADTSANEKDLLPKLKKEDLSSQYASIKNRLKNLLLDFLYERNTKDDSAEQLHRKLCVANLLLNKGHMEIGTQMLQEAKRQAIDYEDYETLLSCIQIEIYTLSNNGTYTAEIQQTLLIEMKDTLRKIEKLAGAIFDSNAVRDSQLKKKPLPDNLPGIPALLQMIETESSVKIRNQYYLMLAAISMKCDPPAETAAYVAANIKLLEDNIKLDPHYIMKYFVAYGPYMPVLLSMNDLNGYREQLRKIEAKYSIFRQYLTPATDIFVLLNIYKYKLSFYRHTGDRKSMLSAALEAEASFTSHYKMITEEGIILYTALLRNSFFFSENYEKAEEWATKDMGQMLIPPPVILAGFIIELVSAYELKNDIDTIRAKVKRIKYYLQNKVEDLAVVSFMEEMIDLIIALINARNQEEKNAVLQNVKELYESGIMTSENAVAIIIRNSFIKFWLENTV